MPIVVLVAPDKFKGTLTAREAALAIAKGWKKARPADQLELAPISDGGDGFGAVLSGLWGAKERIVRTVDAAHRPLRARWWWEPKRRAAIVESAAVIGLAQLPPKRFHPFDLDTYGLGQVIRAARREGAQRCVIGIGGSATNDGGFGVARALGWQFLDAGGQVIERWTDLQKLRQVIRPKRSERFPQVTVAVDVQNPLLGRKGATRIYGPQKGLRTADFAKAERRLRRLAEVVARELGFDGRKLCGAGAAGGLGFGLAKIRRADIVVTGEGRLDESTAMGKGAGELARICSQMRIPCIGLAGEVAPARKLKVFSQTAGLTDLTSAKAAKGQAQIWLARLAEIIARRWNKTVPDW